MLADWFRVSVFVATLGCGLVAGVFFAFSSFAMPALGRLPPPKGVAATQSINVTAVTPAFMLLFFGTTAACGAVLLGSLSRWRGERRICAVRERVLPGRGIPGDGVRERPA